MNIFVLDYDPVKAAKYQCDKHVVKMPLETAQILCSAFEAGSAPYKRTHFNHPCSVWARTSRENFMWLIDHGYALGEEYTFRYGKTHKSIDVISWCHKNIKKIDFPQSGKTKFHLCFDEKYQISNAVESYRRYYKKEKLKIAKWAKSRGQPTWI